MNDGLDVDSSLIMSTDEEQKSETIDSKYGVNLFYDTKGNHSLYDYSKIENLLYSDNESYSLKLSEDTFSKLYTTHESYQVTLDDNLFDYSYVLNFILLAQIFVLLYFVYRLVVISRRKL